MILVYHQITIKINVMRHLITTVLVMIIDIQKHDDDIHNNHDDDNHDNIHDDNDIDDDDDNNDIHSCVVPSYVVYV